MKKVVLASIILALLLTHQLWQKGFPYTHDGENHLARFANYYVAIKEGQIPPRFAPNLHNHYGYPVFNYNYPLANGLSVPFTIIDFSLETTFKIQATAALLLGILGCVWWLRLRGASWTGSFLAAWGASVSPIVMSTLLFRGNIGELWAWGLLPWLLGGVETLFQKKPSVLEKLGLWVVLTAFLLSHNVTVLFGVALVWVYTLIRYGRVAQATELRSFLTWQVIGFLSSCWFWVPALVEKKFITLDGVDLSTSFSTHFPTLQQLVSSPLSFGFSQIGSIDSLSLGAGMWLWLCLVLLLGYAMAGVWRKQELPKLVSIDTTLLVAALLLFQLSWTTPIWQVIPFAQFIQFPWRLLLLLSILSASLFTRWQHWPYSMKWLIGLVLCIQSILILRVVPVDRFHRTTEDYMAFSQTTTTQNENMPKTFTFQEIANWQPTPTVLNGSATFQVKRWTGSSRTYQVEAITAATIIEPTMNFPGWQTRVVLLAGESSTKKEYQTEYVDSESIGGRIAYSLEPGSYLVYTRFTEWTTARVLGDTATLAGLGLAFVWVSWPLMVARLSNRKHENN
jgi:hypothetical protein